MLLDQHHGLHVLADVEPRDILRTADRLSPDVIVAELEPPVDGALTAIARLTQVPPGGPAVLVLAAARDDAGAFAVLRAGARGLLHKGCTVDELVTAIKALAAGGGVLAPPVAGELLARFGRYLPGGGDHGGDLDRLLTSREREVLHLVALGESNQSVARKLSISQATVRSHVHHVLMKLGAGDRTQAVAYAYQMGFVTPFFMR
jgi:DNA-binding NarL/FixJ family response regulator